MNYDYWKTRTEVEASKVTADARRFMMLADQERAKAAPDKAKVLYEQAWTEWAKILEKYPELIERDLADDLKEVIFRYKLVLDQLDEEFPKDFKLQVLADQLERDAAMEAGSGAPPPGSGGLEQDPGQAKWGRPRTTASTEPIVDNSVTWRRCRLARMATRESHGA